MAKFSDVNASISTSGAAFGAGAAEVLFRRKAVMKAAGWTIPASSDGTTYNASGDQITSAGAGAGGLMNVGAWFLAQDPAGRRQLLSQWGTAGGAGSNVQRDLYSALAKFTGGSPGATRVPTAADQQFLLGGGTDASPTYAQPVQAVANIRPHIVAESVAIGGVYPISMFCTVTGSATQATGLFLLEPMAPGSYSVSDADPCALISANLASIATIGCWFAFGTGSQVWTAAVTANAGLFGGALGVDLGDGLDINGLPIYSATLSGSVRIKGFGAITPAKGPARTYPATTNTTTDARCYCGSWAYNYPNNTVPSVA